jgi:hypothetical protein
MPITKNKVSFTYDLSDKLEGVSIRKAAKIKKAVGELLISEIESFTAKQTSPVKSQRAFKPLSDAYRSIKKKAGKGTKANLRLKEKMIPALKAVNESEGVAIKITQALEKKKAENHNHGVTVPRRQFLPDDVQGQDFKPVIKKKVDKLVKSMTDEL